MTTSAPAMIGRDADLARLEARLDEVRAGAPFTVIIGGEAGIGKTRLLREFTAGLAPDIRLLAGQCVDLGSVAAPYAPVKTALRTLVSEVGAERVLEAVGPGRAAFVALLPELVTSDADTATAPPPAGAAASQLHEAIAVLLETFSRERPIVFVIEDLHWIDAASLALLRFLMRALGSSRVLTVLSYRTEDVTRGHPVRAFLSEAERDRWVERRELSRLTRAQVRKLAKSLIVDTTPSQTALDTLFRRSDGVPFFVEELVGIDGCRDEGFVPDTLRELLLARYERLPESAQELLRLISTGGVRVSHSLLSAVYAGTVDELDAAARQSVLAGVLTIEGDDYAFRHALVREAILSDLLPGERARFHARYAEAYEAMAAAGTRRLAAEISFHWLGAHDAVRAFPATMQAMREARDAAAYETAAQLGERALGLWDVVPDPEQAAGMGKLELMGRTASHLRNAGEGERSLALVKAALAECPRDDPNYPRLLRDKALNLANVGRGGSIPLLEEALEVLGDAPSELRTTTYTGLAGRLMIEGRLDEAVETAERALDMALEIGSPRFASIATNIAAVSRAHRGEVEQGIEVLERARALAEGDGGALLRYWVNASDLHFLVGNHREAVRLAEEGLAAARTQGVERSSGVILASNAVDPLFALGEWDRAQELIDRAIALDPPAPFTAYLQRARIWSLLWRGDAAAAADALRAARSFMAPIMEVEMQTRLGVARVAADIALANGDLVAAWREVRGPLHERFLPLPGYALPIIWAGGRLIADAHRHPDAVPADTAAEIAAAEPALRSLLARFAFWPSQPLWGAFFEAELAGAASDGPGTDIAAWRDAVTVAAGPTAPVYLAAYALLRQGEAELAAGDRLAARATLQAAFDVSESSGVGAVRDRVVRVCGAAGLGLDDGTSADGRAAAATADATTAATAELTARERQVLELIAEGLSNRQIGERLFISGKTASVHVSAILRKLGAATRTEAAYRAGALS
ncbi:AAA family ATPase [Agromyces sp. ISL-38]|uniref:helix-turn-helix transcriptional regulator n=1 Tax=Agromyces sp. ISL-38 TaxID=2819107 RepID=UPI001BEB28D0|nr:AAA family ATPase [Agromyces sp. ISL-38]MBT2497858.1 AAA family ATPase [Agromyces sp. ISL-38]MBT2517054.1 AAA family ATPase [Streptomyces sp. ISL-90]